MKYILGLIILFTVHFAQARKFDTTLWRPDPAYIQLEDEELEDEDAVIIEDNRMLVNKNSKIYITRHRITQVNTQSGLDDHNKIVVYIPSGGKVDEIRARSISPDGNVIELNQDNIKEMENYGSGELHLFAVEGAAIGSQIEYSYTLIYPYTIGMERFSKEYKTLHASLIIDYTGFKAGESDWKVKGYNADFKRTNGNGSIFFETFDLIPLEDELYSTPDANQAFIEYHFNNSESTLTSTAAGNYKRFYLYMEQQLIFKAVELGQATSEISKYKIKVPGDEEQTLMNLNAHIKQNFFYTESGSARDDIGQVFMTNKANELGFIKLYAILLEKLEIDYQILYTCSKYDRYFDTTAFSFYTLEDYLFYFPTVEKYLDPLEKSAHFGIIPYGYLGNNSFVIHDSKRKRTMNINNVPVWFHNIQSQPYDQNTRNFDISVDIAVDNRESVYHIAGTGTGQFAYRYNDDVFYTETKQEEEEAMIDLIDWFYPSEEVLSCRMVDQNKWGDIAECEDYMCKRSFNAEIRSGSFFETVGDKLILRVGSLIGPQDEFNVNHPRVQDIVTTYKKSYNYDIIINIPTRYKYIGQQNADINSNFEIEGKSIAQFKSQIKVEGNVIRISIQEFYDQLLVKKDHFEDFRKVINAAAQFNSAVVLLQKL
ncbi:MAG: DUF3857 domain-containing protein [Crocinitomicaceae bacterium]